MTKKYKPCQCTVCRYNRGEITRHQALNFSSAEKKELEEIRDNDNADKWAVETNLDFLNMFIDDLEKKRYE